MRGGVAQNHQHRSVRINPLGVAEVADGLGRDQVGQVVLVTQTQTDVCVIVLQCSSLFPSRLSSAGGRVLSAG